MLQGWDKGGYIFGGETIFSLTSSSVKIAWGKYHFWAAAFDRAIFAKGKLLELAREVMLDALLRLRRGFLGCINHNRLGTPSQRWQRTDENFAKMPTEPSRILTECKLDRSWETLDLPRERVAYGWNNLCEASKVKKKHRSSFQLLLQRLYKYMSNCTGEWQQWLPAFSQSANEVESCSKGTPCHEIKIVSTKLENAAAATEWHVAVTRWISLSEEYCILLTFQASAEAEWTSGVNLSPQRSSGQSSVALNNTGESTVQGRAQLLEKWALQNHILRALYKWTWNRTKMSRFIPMYYNCRSGNNEICCVVTMSVFKIYLHIQI